MNKENIRKIKFKNTLKIEFEVMEISNVFKRFQDGNLEFDIGKFHRPQFNMILLVENDSAKHFVDFKTYDVKKGDILLVGENYVHAFSRNQKLKGTAIIFTSNFIEINEIGMNSLKKLFNMHLINESGKDRTIKELFKILKCEYKGDKVNSIILYRYLLGSILTKLDILVDENKLIKDENKNTKIMLTLDGLIEKFNYQCRDSIEYTKGTGYSYKQLNIICKSVTGYTLKSYIDNMVILEMKRQIVANDMSLKEMCIFFNFDEETNLVKYFKRNVGTSPKKFKDQYQNFHG
ncbi:MULTISPECIES: AraC family transcriptional regulator [Psychrilyobacter]|uniref:Helix-turn-helix domain-containing protein n=1 Tax=Psychrilyobacter piezotolerans TaxID=2293438 RepID=A0ABX9KFS8_9FUSO|nr:MULTISPECIES: helix-turn-helix transcriptional regulator [Psychrilyobacter]MCS5422846.1 helix-turn-helix domain-containing protein [Psychrilyobacter sp. S5]NDI78435.1 AraC family transcriptional regulator [Psychrilyobacter piezotolerans]RDE60620.1 AraC family transcriptional regulator [Psychrilyobacter sp. S5]REI40547.1 helix-turn-helix domain-containing protein [Psychrilyobacter piezotolerans]